ncbi:MAG: teicoplanin resistance protein VanZ [Gallionellales bacterium RIFCSPLOWO2_12_FULL_59_22]|nr:MAG: teicoplanin resistance protein VanZ [Gallionellales bacterium RIFCSPLOWO2_02_FULL_59_110]OGT02236.1 MAG: teicoplanin resistance protein VanZ [Gallionellales bacterium RIFCSPLOWO2_02_58_13]OGT14350.1 MAG: teicoplanin resistance protein VanZ [Gallionellales bacterium RIFCSPLOWO2_12_FULL_59_22]
MKQIFFSETRARLRTWLVTGYALFIVYASLSPFSGWREQGLNFLDVLREPLRFTYTAFDATANLLSYLPFGLLAGLALRARFGAASSVLLSLCLGVSLSAGMEFLQMYLPARISSNMDLLSNGTGALLGALLAVSVVSRMGLSARLIRWRRSLFHQGKEMDFGLALLALWMFGQINPSLPLLGNVFISEVARQPFAALPPAPFDWWESGAVTLNLLMLGTLLLTLLRAPRNTAAALPVILSAVALVKFIMAAALLKSWALLLWINSEAVLGMLLGVVLLFAAQGLPRGAAIISGAAVALAYFAVTNFVFGDNTPAAAMSVYHWHYGHLLNYNGLAQTISLVFPLLLMFHLWRIRKV